MEKNTKYTVVNKETSLNPDFCYPVRTKSSKVVEDVPKEEIDNMSEIFDELRKNSDKNIETSSLENEIENARKKVQIENNKKLVRTIDTGGYIAVGAIITVVTIVLATIIFIGVGTLLGQ